MRKRKNRIHHIKICLLAVACASAISCEKAFDIHPYDVNPDLPTHINAKNIEKIEQQCAGKDTIVVAVISDTHEWYTQLNAEVDDINRRPDVDFVMHLGDMTNVGQCKEFEWFHERLSRLRKPYVVLIGNHDLLGTGGEVYDYAFGPRNFSFIAGGIKFLCLDSNAGEYDYMADVPNLTFIGEEIARDSALFNRTVVAMHVPPLNNQFNNNVALVFREYLRLYPELQCALFGHNHTTYEEDIFGDGLTFYGVGCAKDRQYRIFTFTKSGYEVEIVDF